MLSILGSRSFKGRDILHYIGLGSAQPRWQQKYNWQIFIES